MKSKKWLAAVGSLDCCVLCNSYGVQVAHRNEGKGMGTKTSDCLTAALCMACHYEIDNGRHYTRDERRALMDKAIVLTFNRLVENGLVGLL